MTKTELRDYRRLIAEQCTSIDFTKNYFVLSIEELTELEQLYQAFKFDGRNDLGISYSRKFYYYLQKGKLPF